MPICPNGHPSNTADFCSVCGVEMTVAASGAAAPILPVPVSGKDVQHCPVCNAARDPAGGEFCEVCGHNFRTGATGIPHAPNAGLPVPPVEAIPPAPGATVPPSMNPAESGQIDIHPAPGPADPPTMAPVPAATLPRWELHVTVEPALNGNTPDPEAPVGAPPRLFPLDGKEALIGRRSARRNLIPEVALDGDDGISHRHALLQRQSDNSFALLDLGSANGTRLNGTELPPNVLSAPLADGDRIELGRWTRVTVRVRPGGG